MPLLSTTTPEMAPVEALWAKEKEGKIKAARHRHRRKSLPRVLPNILVVPFVCVFVRGSLRIRRLRVREAGPGRRRSCLGEE